MYNRYKKSEEFDTFWWVDHIYQDMTIFERPPLLPKIHLPPVECLSNPLNLGLGLFFLNPASPTLRYWGTDFCFRWNTYLAYFPTVFLKNQQWSGSYVCCNFMKFEVYVIQTKRLWNWNSTQNTKIPNLVTGSRNLT